MSGCACESESYISYASIFKIMLYFARPALRLHQNNNFQAHDPRNVLPLKDMSCARHRRNIVRVASLHIRGAGYSQERRERRRGELHFRRPSTYCVRTMRSSRSRTQSPVRCEQFAFVYTELSLSLSLSRFRSPESSCWAPSGNPPASRFTFRAAGCESRLMG